jgi:hypothetical protein
MEKLLQKMMKKRIVHMRAGLSEASGEPVQRVNYN